MRSSKIGGKIGVSFQKVLFGMIWGENDLLDEMSFFNIQSKQPKSFPSCTAPTALIMMNEDIQRIWGWRLGFPHSYWPTIDMT